MAAQERRGKCSNARQRRQRAKRRQAKETAAAIAADPKLLATAVANKWPVPPEVRNAIISRLNTVIRQSADDPTAIKAANAVIAMVRSNIAADRIHTPDVSIQTTINNRMPTREEITDMLNNLK